MNLLLLGRGKTGSLVAEVAAERRHQVRVAGAKENANGAALTPASLENVGCVIDFTAPHSILPNIEACVKAVKNMVVGTTGWYKDVDHVRQLVKQHGTGFLYSPNFSVGVSLFLEIARTAAAALQHSYGGADLRTPSRPQKRRTLGHRDRTAATDSRSQRSRAARPGNHLLPRRRSRGHA